jgi:hypothetical protein
MTAFGISLANGKYSYKHENKVFHCATPNKYSARHKRLPRRGIKRFVEPIDSDSSGTTPQPFKT